MAQSMLNRILYIAIAFIGLSGVVCLHELGHFGFCKLFGVATPVFSIGFGPRLLEKKIGSTIFALSALPFGGYVSIKGMDAPSFGKVAPTSFNAKPYWQKIAILLGGILANLLFGFFAVLFFYKNRKDTSESSETGLIGPIGILRMISNSASFGWRNVIFMLGVLSINLGLINLLPLPVFDGGQIVLVTFETIKGSPISSTIKNSMDSITWFLLIAFMLYTAVKDTFAK